MQQLPPQSQEHAPPATQVSVQHSQTQASPPAQQPEAAGFWPAEALTARAPAARETRPMVEAIRFLVENLVENMVNLRRVAAVRRRIVVCELGHAPGRSFSVRERC